MPSPAEGSAEDLLAAIEADGGIYTPLIQGGSAEVFAASQPLTAQQLAERIPARQRLRILRRY